MLYLATQFVWFLLAAFAMGFVIGWLSSEGGKLELWSGQYLYAAGIWLLGAALAWLQTVNGVPALWLETGLLFIAVYVAGCALATVVRASLSPQNWVEAVTGVDAGSGLQGAAAALVPGGAATIERAAAFAGDNKAVIADAKDALDKAGEVKAIVDDGKELAGTAKSAVELVSRAESQPVQTFSGEKPSGLAAARGDRADDLLVIKGVGPQNEARLHGLGIWHFDQIAAWTPENVEWVGGYLAFPGRIEREDWVGQAKVLAAASAATGKPRRRTPRA